ncbi:rod shape-determining protein MreC [Patescibacteria group bacterium]|nr:rod shape-determining protein MreC [Patescibacteria group bacterium]
MKMNFHPQNKSSKRVLIKRIIIFVSLALVLATFNVTHFNPFSGLFNYIAEPFWKGRQAVLAFGVDVSIFFRSNKSLAGENKILSRRIVELERAALMEGGLFKENEELKALLGRDTVQHTILAAVLTRPFLSPYGTFMVDVGRDSGISIGDRVVVDGTFVVGAINKVFQKTAQVKLFSAPGEKINVALVPSNLLVVAEGRGGSNFKVTLPRGIAVSEGDALVIPDINIQILGIVEKISITPASSFQIIYFKSPINMAYVKWVQVIHAL